MKKEGVKCKKEKENPFSLVLQNFFLIKVMTFCRVGVYEEDVC
jgi:hypothetical protein